MTERTTKADLEQLMAVLNNRLGRPTEWGKPGNLHLQEAYGNGPRMYENLGEGTREIGPRMRRGLMADYIRGMLIGIDFAETNVRSAAPNLGGLPGWGETPDLPGYAYRPGEAPTELADRLGDEVNADALGEPKCHYVDPFGGPCLLDAYHALPHDDGTGSRVPGWDGAGASVEAQRG